MELLHDQNNIPNKVTYFDLGSEVFTTCAYVWNGGLNISLIRVKPTWLSLYQISFS